MSDGPGRAVAELASNWGEHTSARSVLVTVFGDSIAPLGGEIWLADVFGLVEPFGFSQRLVRTSMFRLVNEGWLDNERIGRRSRYRLTPFAALEFADADRRIYQRRSPAWDEQWSLVLTGTDLTTGDDRDRLVNHLRWHGFVEIAPGVWALPEPKPDAANELLDRLGLASRPPVAQANFDRLGELVDEGLFRASFDLGETEAVYREFVERFGPLSEADLGGLTPMDALESWVGHRAFALAGEIYRAVTERAWEAVEALTDLRLADADARVAARFVEG